MTNGGFNSEVQQLIISVLSGHPVRDPSIIFDEAGYLHFRIHQTLEPPHNLVVGYQYRTHPNRPISISGRNLVVSKSMTMVV